VGNRIADVCPITGDPQHHLDRGMHCAEPEGQDRKLHHRLLIVWIFFCISTTSLLQNIYFVMFSRRHLLGTQYRGVCRGAGNSRSPLTPTQHPKFQAPSQPTHPAKLLVPLYNAFIYTSILHRSDLSFCPVCLSIPDRLTQSNPTQLKPHPSQPPPT
jgi:hypothetical protein